MTCLLLPPPPVFEFLLTHNVYSMLKRRGKGRFHVLSAWNTRGVLTAAKVTFTDIRCKLSTIEIICEYT